MTCVPTEIFSFCDFSKKYEENVTLKYDQPVVIDLN